MSMSPLDDPGRYNEIRQKITQKPFLRKVYEDVYRNFQRGLQRCPEEGGLLEIGSGAGFLKDILPEIQTSDLIPYPGLDLVFDATRRIPFPDSSLRAVFLWNVFHHLPDTMAFFSEIDRCLRPGGRLFITDPYPGWVGRPIYRHLHHQPFHPHVEEWGFPSLGPLSSSNLALAWLVFERDLSRFEKSFPGLHRDVYRPNRPFAYWVSGGLSRPALLPASFFGLVRTLDGFLSHSFPRCSSFVDIEIVKKRKGK